MNEQPEPLDPSQHSEIHYLNAIFLFIAINMAGGLICYFCCNSESDSGHLMGIVSWAVLFLLAILIILAMFKKS